MYDRRFESMSAASVPVEMTPTEDQRAHLFSMSTAAGLPMIQAFVSGVFLGLAVGWIAYLASWSRPWIYGVSAWLFVQALAWLKLLSRWLNLTMPFERVFQRDFNGDGIIGRPSIHIELARDVDGSGRQIQFLDFPVGVDKMAALARALLAGLTFSEANFTGSSGIFSRSEFRTIRGELLKRGLLVQSNPKSRFQGFELNAAGRAVLRRLADETAHLSDQASG